MGIKISGLTAATSMASADLLEIETSGGDSKKITLANVLGAPPAIGGTTPAAITGTTITGTTITGTTFVGDGSSLTGITATATGSGHIYGLKASHAADTDHDITVAAGESALDDNSAIWKLASATTKQIDATYADGDAAGGLFSGTVANSTIYYRFLTRKDSDGTIGWGWDTSSSAANVPAGYTAGPMIGYSYTNGSANILWDIGTTGYRGKWKMVTPLSFVGSSIPVEYIPSWVTKITGQIKDVSTDGTMNVYLRLGDSGGLETTGYTGGGGFFVSSEAVGYVVSYIWGAGFPIFGGDTTGDTSSSSARFVLELIDAANNTWAFTLSGARSTYTYVFSGHGYKSLSAALTQLVFVTTATNFDAGMFTLVLEA